jgi:hypothetical protein
MKTDKKDCLDVSRIIRCIDTHKARHGSEFVPIDRIVSNATAQILTQIILLASLFHNMRDISLPFRVALFASKLFILPPNAQFNSRAPPLVVVPLLFTSFRVSVTFFPTSLVSLMAPRRKHRHREWKAGAKGGSTLG